MWNEITPFEIKTHHNFKMEIGRSREVSTYYTCATWLINLWDGTWVGFFVQEMTRVAGADTFSGSQTRLLTRMQIGCWTMVTRIQVRNGEEETIVKNWRWQNMWFSPLMGLEEVMEMVRQPGYCGFAIWRVNLRGLRMVASCWGIRLQWKLNVRHWDWVLRILRSYFRRKQNISSLLLKMRVEKKNTKLTFSPFVSLVLALINWKTCAFTVAYLNSSLSGGK